MPPPLPDVRGRTLWAAILLLILGLVQLNRTLHDSQSDLDALYTSDTLFPMRVCDDLFLDGYPLTGWQFPVAPFWFPDTAGLAVLRGVTGNSTSAVMAYGYVQFLTVVAAFVFLMVTIVPDRPRAAATGTLTAATVALLVCIRHKFHGMDWSLLFQVQLHTGAFAVDVFATAAGLRLLGATSTVGRLGWAAAIAVAVIPVLASDGILLLWLVIPTGVSVLVAWWMARRSGGGIGVNTTSVALLVATLAGSVVVGRWLYGTYHGGLDHPSQNDYRVFNSEVMIKGLKALWTAMRSGERWWLFATAGGMWLVAFGIVARRLYRFAWQSQPAPITAGELLAGIGVVSVSVSLPVVAGLGLLGHPVYPWPWPLKYLMPVFFAPMFLLGGLWALLPNRWRSLVGGGVGIALVGWLILLAVRPIESSRSVWKYYPDDVRAWDAAAERHGLTVGLGAFWEAHRTTVLSRRGLKVYPVEPTDQNPWGFTTYHWLSNRHWYTGTPAARPTFGFLLLGDVWSPDRAKAEAAFGPPADVVTVGKRSLVVYNGSASPLTAAMRDDGAFISRSAKPGLPRAVELTGRALPRADCGRDEPNGDRVIVAPDRPGHVSVTRPLPVTPGRYRVELTFSADQAKDSTWHVFEQHPSRPPGSFEYHGGEDLSTGQRTTRSRVITIPEWSTPEPSALTVRILFGGHGQLVVHNLRFERVD